MVHEQLSGWKEFQNNQFSYVWLVNPRTRQTLVEDRRNRVTPLQCRVADVNTATR